MAILIQITSLMLLFGIIYSWPYSMVLEGRMPLTYVHTSVEEGSASPSSSIFDDINRMMANMHQRFEHMFGWPSFPMFDGEHDYDLMDNDDRLNPMDNLLMNQDRLNPVDNLLINQGRLSPIDNVLIHEKTLNVVDDSDDIETKLDNVVPVCTVISDSPTAVSQRKSRRKKVRTTQTTKCVKELIINGQKHFSEEITTTDDKNAVIKQSKSYGIVAIDADQTKQ
jgi:hypothetical protein